jgi:hypothetical protein
LALKSSDPGDKPRSVRFKGQTVGDYFTPWRRKFGVLTLVMACVFAAGWVRSISIEDQIQIKPPDRWHRFLHVFESSHSVISWVALDMQFGEIQWQSAPVGADRETMLLEWFPQYAERREKKYVKNWEVPYWSIVIPLTLLSAWLLLIDPRKRANSPPQNI